MDYNELIKIKHRDRDYLRRADSILQDVAYNSFSGKWEHQKTLFFDIKVSYSNGVLVIDEHSFPGKTFARQLWASIIAVADNGAAYIRPCVVLNCDLVRGGDIAYIQDEVKLKLYNYDGFGSVTGSLEVPIYHIHNDLELDECLLYLLATNNISRFRLHTRHFQYDMSPPRLYFNLYDVVPSDIVIGVMLDVVSGYFTTSNQILPRLYLSSANDEIIEGAELVFRFINAGNDRESDTPLMFKYICNGGTERSL